MISVRNPCHGSLPETFAFGGAPERGFLAEANHFLNGFLAPERILGEHVTKHIDICRFALHVDNVTKPRAIMLFQLEVSSKCSHKPSPQGGKGGILDAR